MPDIRREPVTVSRQIGASAEAIFAILADPRRHLELDGSGMLRGTDAGAPVTSVGDVFVMRMHYEALGDYEMNNHVVEYEPNRRVGWEPEAGRGHPGASEVGERWGHRWVYDLAPDGPGATVVTETYDVSRVPEEALEYIGGAAVLVDMTRTLERLDEVCTGRAQRATT